MKIKNNFIKNLKILDGIIVYNDFDIDENISFEEQRYSYKEDMLQIKYGERFLLDVGWYPEFQQNGSYIVYVIQDKDWQNPILKIKCRALVELKKTIEKAALFIGSKRKIKNLPFRDVEYDKD